MFAVGTLDAYFCDAYTDLVAATANSKSRQPSITLPDWAYDIKVPIRAILEEYDNSNWRWRMAARKMMERENVFRLSTIQTLFNKFFRKGRRFWHDCLDDWISRPDSRIRLFGVSRAGYQVMPDSKKKQPPQQNLWVRFGSGRCPRLCKRASFATFAVRKPYDFLVTNFTLLLSPSTAPAETCPRARNQFRISGR